MPKVYMSELKSSKVLTLILFLSLVTAALLVDVYDTSAQRPAQGHLEEIGRTAGH